MFEAAPSALKHLSTDVVAGGLILLVALLVFWFSPVHQVTDSHYSMLLSESLIKHRSFALDSYNLPRLEPKASTRDYYVMNGDIWQLELAGGHLYYYFPPGSSVLSLPYVAAANVFGISAANADRTYNPQGEVRIETGLAAILMALLAVVFYFTSRLLLPISWSVILACAGAFGSQIWSTASRGLWSQTWATFLAGIIVWILVSGETGRRKINPILLATLLSWLYFVRPIGSVTVIALTIYIVLFHRKILSPFVLTGAVWVFVFIVYSWVHFARLLPSYYQASRLRFDLLPVALAGNVFSPSRGLLVYVPTVLFVIYLLVKYWQHLPSKRLVWLSLSICGLHILFVSAFANLWGDWWGGASFGPRYLTELVPWFALLAILGLKGRLAHATQAVSLRRSPQANSLRYSEAIPGLKVRPMGRESPQANSLRYLEAIPEWEAKAVSRGTLQTNSLRYFEITAGALLLALSIFINGRGAVSLDTWKWTQPSTDQQLRALLWDWHHPQFLAGLQQPAPIEFPLVQPPSNIDLSSPEAGKYLWYGWSGAEKDFRWTDGKEATVVFSLNDGQDLLLEMKLAPFLASPQLVEQKVILKLNQQSLATFTLTDGEMKTYSVKLSQHMLTTQNVLAFKLPDAAAPTSLKVGTDDRLLGIRLGWIRFRQMVDSNQARRD